MTHPPLYGSDIQLHQIDKQDWCKWSLVPTSHECAKEVRPFAMNYTMYCMLRFFFIFLPVMTANPYYPVTTVSDTSQLADDDWGLNLPGVQYSGKHPGSSR